MTRPYVDPQDMLAELREDNQRVITALRETHDLCDEHNDVATASFLETFIDDAERARLVSLRSRASRRPNRTLSTDKHGRRRRRCR